MRANDRAALIRVKILFAIHPQFYLQMAVLWSLFEGEEIKLKVCISMICVISL